MRNERKDLSLSHLTPHTRDDATISLGARYGVGSCRGSWTRDFSHETKGRTTGQGTRFKIYKGRRTHPSISIGHARSYIPKGGGGLVLTMLEHSSF